MKSNVETHVWGPARKALAEMAFELEARFVGGTAFFDALDEALRVPMYFRALVSRAIDEYPEVDRFVVSGKFGEALALWITYSEFSTYLDSTLVVPGGLRHNDLPPFQMARFGRTVDGVGRIYNQFVFLDDSYYKGRTYEKVKQRVEEAGGDVLGAVVLYDGSPEPPAVTSFFGTTNRQG